MIGWRTIRWRGWGWWMWSEEAGCRRNHRTSIISCRFRRRSEKPRTMPKPKINRPAFREWVDNHKDPQWTLMPLTHITKGIGAEDICRAGGVKASHCDVFNHQIAYFFYGRPAYRVHGDGAVKLEAACPYCFIFTGNLIEKSDAIYAFDTGAFKSRLYSHILLEEMNVEDFGLEKEVFRPNRLVSAVFENREDYFFGDTTKIKSPEQLSSAYEFHARSYLHLITSTGRNEPDDRICSIEVQFQQDVPLDGNLLAVVVPHTVWEDGKHAPWLEKLSQMNILITPYLFTPGRHPDYYYAMIETVVKDIYKGWGAL